MATGRRWVPLPWCVAAAVLTLGVLLRDCVLVASSALVFTHGFYSSMDTEQPWDGLRAAVRCWAMSGALLVFAFGLLTWVAAALLGSFSPHNDSPVATIAVLGGSVLLLTLTQQSWTTATSTLILCALIASAITLYLNALGVEYAPCLFAAGVSAMVGGMSLRLAFRVAPEMLRSGMR
jgi:hypothetical protein